MRQNYLLRADLIHETDKCIENYNLARLVS